MVKPEEVFVTVNENGDVIREIYTNLNCDLDILSNHKIMQLSINFF